MDDSIPDWFHDTIMEVLQVLVALSLKDTPAAEIITATSDIWAKALWSKGGWVERLDRPRLLNGVMALSRQVDRWPAPADLIDAMPVRVKQRALPPPPMSDEKQEYGRQKLKEIREMLANVGAPHAAPENGGAHDDNRG